MPTVETIAAFVMLVGGAYLAYRALLVVLRVRWARAAYPASPLEIAPASDEVWADRCRGTLLGLAIGDALGLPTETLPRWLVRLRYPGGPRMRRGVVRFVRRRGDVSDDTQLTIAVARSITLDGTYLHERFVEELRCWSYFAIAAGMASTRAASRMRACPPPDDVGVRSEGNGAAIRMAPLSIARARDETAVPLFDEARRNARATHTGEAAVAGALLMAGLVREALRHPPGSFRDRQLLLDIMRGVAAPAGFSLKPVEQALLSGAPLGAQLRLVGTSGHSAQSVSAALLVLLSSGLELDAAMRAIHDAGGDTDSIGSMVGAVIGAQLGASALPREWSDVVQHRDYLVFLADRLASASGAKATEKAGEILEVTGDIATRTVDVVVNAWSRNVIPTWLLLPQGVSGALRRAGGRCALREISRRAPLPLGAASETAAGNLRARCVVHAAGIDLGWRASEASVRLSTQSSLSLARWLGARTVALPLIGAGSGGMSEAVVRRVMLEELQRAKATFDRLELVAYGRS